MILAQLAQTKKCNYHCSDNTNMYCNFVFIVLKKYLDIFFIPNQLSLKTKFSQKINKNTQHFALLGCDFFKRLFFFNEF